MNESSKKSVARRKVVLITGASTGLGLALAKSLLQEDRFHLILTAKASSLVRFESHGIRESDMVWIRPLDVTNIDERVKVVWEANQILNGVDVLVNNAGYSLRAVVEHVTETERLKQLQINFRAPMGLIRLVLPKMREKRSGKIINISSVGGMMAMPTMAVYSASKFALEGASESLWYEVKPWNIRVTLIQPGFVNSQGFTRVKMTQESQKSFDDVNDAYHQHYRSMSPFVEKMMRRSFSRPEGIAKKILKVIDSKNPPLRVLATHDAIVFGFLRRFLPRRLYHAVLYRFLPNVSHWGES